jgi:DNA repair photolyase
LKPLDPFRALALLIWSAVCVAVTVGGAGGALEETMTRRHVLIKSEIEYVSHACNYATGCTHRCVYCYMGRRNEACAVPFAAAILESDLDRLKEPPSEVLVSSSHDPCQPVPEISSLTENILTVLADREVPTWLLTKGGLRSWRYLDLLKRPGARLGVSITTHDERERERWEPGASSIHDRFLALVNARHKGVSTWASVEPILPGLDVTRLARQLQGLVDWAVIGKWNHRKEAEAIDWPRIREQVEEAFALVGIPYLIKSELAACETRADVRRR